MAKRKLPPYECCRCGYKTSKKAGMMHHLYMTTRECAALVNNMILTPDIKQYILENRIYNDVMNTAAATEIKKLRIEIDLLKNRKQESTYQGLLEAHLQGTHKKLKVGVTDITTPHFHAEIKVWSCWKEVVGQLFAYNFVDPKQELRAYFFGEKPGQEQLNTILHVMTSSGIVPYAVEATVDTLIITHLETKVEEHVRIAL